MRGCAARGDLATLPSGGPGLALSVLPTAQNSLQASEEEKSTYSLGGAEVTASSSETQVTVHTLVGVEGHLVSP